METKANTALIGAFTLVVLALGFVFIYWLARGSEQGSNVPLAVIFRDPVTGLTIGSQVVFNGIKVGDVKTLTLDPKDPKVVIAGLNVQPLRSIKKDTQVTLGFQGLTGVGYIEMAGGSPNLPPIWEAMPQPTIVAQRSSFQDLMAGARTILARTDQTLQTIETLVADNTDDVTQSIRDVRSFTGALSQNSDRVATMIDQIASASAGIADATKRLQGIVDKSERLISAVDPAQVHDIVADIHTAAGDIAAQTARVDAVMQRADEISTDLKSFSAHLPALGDKAEALATSIDPAKVSGTLDRLAAISASIDPEKVRTAMDGAASLGETLTSNKENINTIVAKITSLSNDLSAFSVHLPALGDKAEALAASIDPAKVGAAVDRFAAISASIDPEKVRTAMEGASSLGETLSSNKENIDTIVAKLTSLSNDLSAFSVHLPALGDKAEALATSIDPAKVGAAVDRFAAISASIDPEKVRTAMEGASSLGETLSNNQENIDTIVTKLTSLSNDLSAFSARLPVLGDKAGSLMAAVDPKKVTQTIDNFDRFTTTLAENSDNIDKIIADARDVSGRFKAIGDRADSLLTKLDNMAGEGTGGLIEDAKTTLAAVRDAANAFNTQIVTVGNGVGDFSGRGLRDFRNLISEGQRTVSRLDRVLSGVESNPSSLIFGGDKVPEYSGQRR